MEFLQENLLTFIVFSPLVIAFIIFLLPSDEKSLIRWLAFILSLIPLGLTLVAWFGYDRGDAGLQYEVRALWYPEINSSYHLAVDGISLPMLLLTTILTPLAILASFKIEEILAVLPHLQI